MHDKKFSLKVNLKNNFLLCSYIPSLLTELTYYKDAEKIFVQSISCHCSFSIPTENIGKPEVWNELKKWYVTWINYWFKKLLCVMQV